MTMLDRQDNFDSIIQKIDSNIDSENEKLVSMFFNPKDIDMKTEIPDSALMYLAMLETYTDRLKFLGLKRSSKATKKIILLYKLFMVSRNRQGRQEGTSMIGALRDKLLKNNALGSLFGVNEK